MKINVVKYNDEDIMCIYSEDILERTLSLPEQWNPVYSRKNLNYTWIMKSCIYSRKNPNPTWIIKPCIVLERTLSLPEQWHPVYILERTLTLPG